MKKLHSQPRANSTRRTLLASSIAGTLIVATAQASELRSAEWLGNALQLQLDQPTRAHLYIDPRQPRLILDLADTSIGATQPLNDALRSHPGIVDAQVFSDTSRSRIVLEFNQAQSATLQNTGNQIAVQLTSPDRLNQTVMVSDATTVLAHRLAQPHSNDYRGTPLTLNFQQIETRRALEILAEFTGLNIITSDSVQGNVTLRLHQVPWDQALDVILQAQGLAMRGRGNVLWIAPANELASINEATQNAARAAPLIHAQIPVHYAQASELAKLLEGTQSHLLSPRGSVRVDERTNTLLIRDTEVHLQDIRTALQELDLPAQQVLIESRIVIASDDFTKDLGVKLGIQKVPGDQDGWEVGVSGSIANANTALGGTTPTLTSSDQSRLAVNLPSSNTAGTIGLSIGKLPVGILLDLELSAAQIQGLSETVANPRILTSNGKEALIQQGVEIPYVSETSSGATDVEFKEAVMQLKVTPRITPRGQIVMAVSIKKDSPTTSTYGVKQEPGINTNEIHTEVMIADGETLVIGGIYEEINQIDQTKVPFLGDLPFLGRLFRSDYKDSQKAELLVFLTPQILKEGIAPPSQRHLQMPPVERPEKGPASAAPPQS
jgi:type IV pilus secretin PilQ/predicted competence protein